ncbi:hypothetical protein ACQP3J_33610, partial [Escherichia coli]
PSFMIIMIIELVKTTSIEQNNSCELKLITIANVVICSWSDNNAGCGFHLVEQALNTFGKWWVIPMIFVPVLHH